MLKIIIIKVIFLIGHLGLSAFFVCLVCLNTIVSKFYIRLFFFLRYCQVFFVLISKLKGGDAFCDAKRGDVADYNTL